MILPPPPPPPPKKNDLNPLLTITPTQASVTEGGTSTFTITRDNVEGALEVSLTLSGSAEHNVDYTVDPTVDTDSSTDSSTGDKTMTVVFENSKKSVDITITAKNDEDTEVNGETVVIKINESDDYTIGDRSTATLTIVDPAPSDAPVVSISTSDTSNAVNEGGTITVTISSSKEVSNGLEVSLTIGGDATIDEDYELPGVTTNTLDNTVTATVTINDGEKSATITIPVLDDNDHEEDETVVMSVDPSSNYHINNGEESATVTILNDDLPTVGFRTTSQTLQEGDDEGVTVIVERSTDEVRDPLTVQLTIEGDATIDEDYELPGVTTTTLDDTVTATVTIPRDTTTVTFTITAVNDEDPEDSGEEVVITIKESGDYTIGDPSTATFTIIDPTPSDAPVVSISTSDTSNAVNEGGTITVTISSSKRVDNLNVDLIIGGDATIDTDYTGLSNVNVKNEIVTATVTIPSGDTKAMLTIEAINDSIHELAEDLTITIDSVTSDYSVPPGGNSVTVTINEDIDDLPTVSIGGDASISEGGQATLTLTRSNDEVGDPLTVQLSFTGTAKPDDYTGSTNARFEKDSDEVTITLTAEENDIHEGAKTVVITIIDEPSSTYRIKKGEETVTVTINDDDLPTVSIAVDSGSISESSADSVVEITLTRSNDEVRDSLTVQLSFTGSARKGVDFEQIIIPIIILNTEASVNFELNPIDDGDLEGNEEVIITIINSNAYTINEENRKVTITIVDDDDTDGDTIGNSEDVDDDNNGLIEIHNLDMLRNVHFNLAGTSYDDEEDDGSGTGDLGDTNGGPTESTDHCSTLVNKVYLCGYELMHDLDFNDAKSYATGIIKEEWRPDEIVNSNDATNAGFPGIGAATGASGGFTGIFEGNGHSISNLYMRNTTTDRYNTGLFRLTSSGAKIRNLGMTNVSIYGGAGDYDRVGGLVGYNDEGTITASYASGTVDDGAGDYDRVGGLVGYNDEGPITASYASGTVDDGDGLNDRVGGLVGYNYHGTITASYATGDVDGGAGDRGNVGGLVGYNLFASILASYATGTVDGGAGTSDLVGGLVGYNFVGDILASYATGTVDGGAGTSDLVGGLVGYNTGPITASYASGTVDGGAGTSDLVGGLVGDNDGGNITASYGFGTPSGGTVNSDDTPKPENVNEAFDLTKDNAGTEWNNAGRHTLDAWDFGTSSQNPALKYADYDGPFGSAYSCNQFPATIPGANTPLECGTTLLPGQGR